MPPMTDGSQLEGKQKEAFVEELFNDIARPYDRLNRICSLGRDEAWRRRLIDLVGLRQGNHAVDMGTGTGDLLLAMLHKVGEQGSVTGLDISSEMLNVAREKVAAGGACRDNVSLLEGNAETTGLEPEHYDVATMGWVLRNVGDRGRVYEEVLRILKPGGRFGIIEMSQPDNWFLRCLSRVYIRGVMPWVARLAGGSRSAYEYLASSTYRFPSKRELSIEWEKAGFVNVTCRSMMMGTIAIHVGTKGSS